MAKVKHERQHMIQIPHEPIQKRVGLCHVSKVIERLIRLYELQADVEAVEAEDAAMHFESEFGQSENGVVVAPAPVITQGTFGWDATVRQ